MRTLKNQKGLSLIEVTIMLLVLMLLTGVLAPSIFDFIKDAQWVKVKEDCEAIALSVARLHRDVGYIDVLPGSTIPASSTFEDRAEVLYSAGGVFADSTTGAAIVAGTNAVYNKNFPTIADAQNVAHQDTLENQLTTNTPKGGGAYGMPATPFASPAFNVGWRGAYLGAPIGPDPWGRKYYVNSAFLTIASNEPGPGVGGRDYGWPYDTFCLSAGPNGVIQTDFAQDGAIAGGDDFITIISGGTR